MTASRVLVTGGGGQLASDLEELLADRAEVRAPSRSELDVTDDPAVDDLLVRVQDLPAETLSDPRNYNIRWLELMNELKPKLERFESVL